MDTESRGAQLKKRRIALGLSQHGVAKFAHEQKMKLSRDSVRAAEDNSASDTTYEIYNAALDRWVEIRDAAKEKGELDLIEEDEDNGNGRLVEFRVSGDFGVDVVVKGPASDLEALEASAMRIMRNIRKDQGS